jgi:hypothetical protein
MTFHHALVQAAQRRHLADELRNIADAETRLNRLSEVAIDTGGSIIDPAKQGRAGPVYAEITLLGLYHIGETMEEAIAEWIKVAQRCAPINVT